MLTPRQWARLGLSIVRGMRDSKRTDELIVAEELVCRERFAKLHAELAPALARDAEARALLADKPRLARGVVDYAALRALPDGTLGRAYVGFLDRHGLDPDALAGPAGQASGAGYADPDTAFLHERYRQSHDVWHALTGLGIEGYEEVVLHAFTWGQLRLPYSALVVTFGTLKHVLLEGRWGVLRHGLGEAYRAGLAAKPLLLVRWEARWAEPVAAVRAALGVRLLGQDGVAAAAA